jgi:hypothetical protein
LYLDQKPLPAPRGSRRHGLITTKSSGFRRIVALVALAVIALFGGDASSQTVSVPASIQTELLAKLESYDRGFSRRAGRVARIVLIAKAGNAKSQLSAEGIQSALSRLERFGGLPHQEVIVPYESAEALAQRCRAERVAVVYVTPGFASEMPALRAALSNVPVLSVSADSADVPEGIVLAFELESGRPKIVINLGQARKQGVEFPAELLRMMKVYR